MTSVARDERNVVVWGVDGTSDELDRPLAALFADAAFRQRYRLGSLNSVNVARVLVQTVHFFYAALQSTQPGQQARAAIFVPSGAGGNVAGGLIARQMGLPVTLCAATNSNDVLARFVQTGVFERTGGVLQTLAPSMDIQAPYNIERLVFYLFGGDGAKVACFMADMESSGKAAVEEALRLRLQGEFGLSAAVVSDAEIAAAIKETYASTGYMLDPHTAVGVSAARIAAAENPVCLGCAHPAKFPQTIKEILGPQTPLPDAAHPSVARVRALGETLIPCRVLQRDEDWEQVLRQLIPTLPTHAQAE